MAARSAMREMAVVVGLKVMSEGERVRRQDVKTFKKDTRMGKLLLVPMNSKSHETSAWG